VDFPISVPSIGLVDGKFVDENPYSGMPGSLIPAAWGNSITTEVLNVIEAAGLAPSEVDLTQLQQAIRLIVQADSGKFGTDTGAANVYTVAYTPAIPALVNGVPLRFKAKTANTGASTFSQNGGPAKALVGLGLGALQGGEIVVDGLCTVVYSAMLDKFILLECTGGALAIAPASKSHHAMQLGQATGRLVRSTLYRDSAGTLQASIDGGAFANISATFVPHPDAVFGEGEVLGGGAAGANAASTATGQVAAGPGGGAGGWAYIRRPISAFAGQTITVGKGGPASTNGAGGTSAIGSLISATGGFAVTPAISGTPSGIPFGISSGGRGSGGDLNAEGGAGASGVYSPTPQSGTGGTSRYGGGPSGNGGAQNTGTPGADAFSPGTGGAGAANGSAVPAARAGGKGADGLTLIREWA
jgi:hypothetical protein